MTRGTRQLLVEAAVALAEKAGEGAVGLREAARVAGVTHGAPYRHFKNRQELVAAVAENGFRSLLTECMLRQAKAGADPRLQFQAVGVATILFAVRRPGQFRVMYGAEASSHGDVVRSVEATVFSLVVNAIAGAQREGLVAHADPQELAMAAWASLHGYAVLTLNGFTRWVGLHGEDPEVLAQRFTAQVFDGLRASEGGCAAE